MKLRKVTDDYLRGVYATLVRVFDLAEDTQGRLLRNVQYEVEEAHEELVRRGLASGEHENLYDRWLDEELEDDRRRFVNRGGGNPFGPDGKTDVERAIQRLIEK